MSVALLITPQKSALSPKRIVPIATQEVFHKRWIPAAVALGLRWIPLFESGVALDGDSLPDVVREFEAVRARFEESGALDAALVERVDRVLEELRNLEMFNSDVDVFIG